MIKKSTIRLTTSIGYGSTPTEAIRQAHRACDDEWKRSEYAEKGERRAISTALAFNPQNMTLNDAWIFTITTEYERPE